MKPRSPLSSPLSITPRPLEGLRIVITRPEPAATKTVLALQAAGAEAIAMPMLDIAPLSVKSVVGKFKPLLDAINTPTNVIFVSSHAAQYGVPVLNKMPDFQPYARYMAVGATTAAKLKSLGVDHVEVPTSGQDSEALLAMPQLQDVSGKTVVIIRGTSEAGGREFLADSLTARGAMVVGIACYQRASRVLDIKERAAMKWAIANSTHVLVGSVETLEAIADNISKALVSRIPHLLVPHERVALFARRRKVREVTVVSLDDNSLIETLTKMNT